MTQASKLADYFAMGGYASYVWPAYIVALVVIGGMALQTHLQWRSLHKRLQAAEAGHESAK